MTIQRLSTLCLLGALVLASSGCGEVKQQYETSAAPNVTITSKQRIKQWLDGVAQSGTIDSGVSLIRDEIDKLPADSGVNVEELKKGFADLESSKSPAATKKLAETLSSKIPE